MMDAAFPKAEAASTIAVQDGGARPVLAGLMQNWPLTVDRLLTHAAQWHGDRTLASATPQGVIRRSYRDVHDRARRTSAALRAAGIREGDRIATLAMNSIAHFEAWFGIVGMGAVCHTLNPRLSIAQLSFIANHAGDRMIFTDRQFLPLATAVAAACPGIQRIVVLDGETAGDDTGFDAFLTTGKGDMEWGGFSEEAAAGLCYTSGTTGTPKGVLYSHRSNFLHSLMTIQPDGFNLSSFDTILPIVPMFHANAWGLTYSAPAVGARLAMPGPDVGGRAVADLVDAETVTVAFAVPTVWVGLLDYLRDSGRRLPTLKRVFVGGAACSERIVRDFAALDIVAIPAWGMTELSPVGTVASLSPEMANLPLDDQFRQRVKQGRPLCGIDLKLAAPDGSAAPHDGKTSGHLRVRGPGVARGYFGEGAPMTLDAEGYLDTGDVATIDRLGFMQITDRARDMIKSGGEWISPGELEMAALRDPALVSAAVIGIPHPTWDERPLMFAQKANGATIDEAAILKLLSGNFPRWMLPDRIVFIEDMPLGATGKIDKMALRNLYQTL